MSDVRRTPVDVIAVRRRVERAMLLRSVKLLILDLCDEIDDLRAKLPQWDSRDV
jgi:hypothetical protein